MLLKWRVRVLSRSLSWLWGDLSQQEGSNYLATAIRPLPLNLLQLFSWAVLAVNTQAGLPLSLPVLSSHRQNTTKYTHQAAQGWELEMYCAVYYKCVSDATMFVSSTVHLFGFVWECVRSYICISVCTCLCLNIIPKMRRQFFVSAPRIVNWVSVYTH